MTDKNHTKFEEKELRFRQTLSALPDGVVLLRKDLVIQWMNRIAERDLSLDPEKDVGKKLTDVFTNPEFIQHIQSERWKARQLIDLPDGRVLEVRVISAGKKYTVVVTRDITESKRIDDFRRDFVGNVSHELRTPLTVIQGFLELATENPNLNEEDRLHWEMMLEQAERMRALVDDLLALSRLEQDAAPASRELIDVDEILEEAVAEGRMISGGAHEIKITKVAPEGILGDFKDMRSAVTNLVTNAVRYTPKDGKIELSWEVKDDHGILSVKDNGIGIAPEHIPRVTERFYRVDKARSREHGGSGLGLSIVHDAAALYGGTVTVDGVEPHGTRFTVTFPRAKADNAPEAQKEVPET